MFSVINRLVAQYVFACTVVALVLYYDNKMLLILCIFADVIVITSRL